VSSRVDADLLVVGAGPAGVSAVLTAASVGMKTVLVEAERVGAKLHAIGSMENLAGGWSSGPELAEALAADVARLEKTGRCSLVHERAVKIAGLDDVAQVWLADGRVLTAPAAVVATGVAAVGPADIDWLDAPHVTQPAPLWRAVPADLVGRQSIAVLGADRPLGTWLRAHPDADVHLQVLHPERDGYKTEEVAQDRRVHLEAVEHAALAPIPGGFRVTAQRAGGGFHTFAAHVVLMNGGSKPAGLPGLIVGEDGYCPREDQHPRVFVAGDLKGARMQRIAIAMGDGQQSALTPYYEGALGTPL
jgi:thioredoxin reductase